MQCEITFVGCSIKIHPINQVRGSWIKIHPLDHISSFIGRRIQWKWNTVCRLMGRAVMYHSKCTHLSNLHIRCKRERIHGQCLGITVQCAILLGRMKQTYRTYTHTDARVCLEARLGFFEAKAVRSIAGA